ncbi:MAG: DUF2079 domain-containing protein, partial [Dehalococcoidia bacterium]|nr:DUF2079 domain-containing protein [Dehalococcoidia bacterium]
MSQGQSVMRCPPADVATLTRAIVWLREQVTWPRLGLVVGIVVYAALFSALSIQRHDTFGTAGNDLGNMDQAVWNTAHGRWFESTNWRGGFSRLGAHVEPILLPLAMTYWVAPSPKTLLVVQATLVALGAAPLFWLAARRLASEWLALVFAGTYLLFPALQAATLYEFHPLTLTAPFFALAVAGLLERRNALFVAGAVLGVACKEDMPLVAAMMGVYALMAQRRWRLGLATVALSAGWFWLTTSVIIPAFNPLGASPYLPRYRELGGSIPEIIVTVVTQPWRLVQLLHAQDAPPYLMGLLAPVAGLAALAPVVLLPVVPPLALNLLTNNELQRVIETNHYPSPMVPFVVAAAILGAARARAWSRRLPTLRPAVVNGALAAVVGVAAVGYQWWRGFTPLARDFEVKPITEHHRIAQRILALVPRDASVSASAQLNPHLTQRRKVMVFPCGLFVDQATQQTVALNPALVCRTHGPDPIDVVALDTSPLNIQTNIEDQYRAAQRLLANGYGLVAAEDGVLLIQRGARSAATLADVYRSKLGGTTPPQTPLEARFGDRLTLLGYDLHRQTPSTPYLALHLAAGANPDDGVRLFVLTGDPTTGPDRALAPFQLPAPTFLPPTQWAGQTLLAETPTYGRWRRPGAVALYLIATNGGSVWDP